MSVPRTSVLSGCRSLPKFAGTLGLLLLLPGCDPPSAVTDPPLDPTIDADLREVLPRYGVVPIGPVREGEPAMVELGRALMFDPILSGNRDVSCATCHHPQTHGADGLSLAVGTGAAATGGSGTGEAGARTPGAGRDFIPRNAPSLLNQGLRPTYLFWDGRMAGHGNDLFEVPPGMIFPAGLPSVLAAQAMLPVLDRREMRGEPGDSDVFGDPNELAELADSQHVEIWQALMDRLLEIPEYQEMFADAFPEVPAGALGFRHAAEAIAAFTTEGFTKADSPFDRYLAGDDKALTLAAKRGALIFFGVRPSEPSTSGGVTAAPVDPALAQTPCSSCHGGALLGGQSFANVGTPQLGPGGGANPPLDLGRAEIIEDPNAEFYRFAFRTPPLRNVELTSPYMHNGAYADLEAVVRHYDEGPSEALLNYDPSQLSPELRDRVHLDDATIQDILLRLDTRVREPLELSDEQVDDLIEFLRSLTDPAAQDLSALVPERVPSGLPMR